MWAFSKCDVALTHLKSDWEIPQILQTIAPKIVYRQLKFTFLNVHVVACHFTLFSSFRGLDFGANYTFLLFRQRAKHDETGPGIAVKDLDLKSASDPKSPSPGVASGEMTPNAEQRRAQGDIQIQQIDTRGDAHIAGDVYTGGGNFIVGDKVVRIYQLETPGAVQTVCNSRIVT
jgi:hypothetical protein